MKIRQDVIERIKGTDKPIKDQMREEMGISIQAVNHAIKVNRHNGWLTSKPILAIISRNLKLPIAQIVTEEKQVEQPAEV